MKRRITMIAMVCAIGCEKPAGPDTNVPGQYACAHDTKVCPDGTPVGRVGEHCEWAACPGPNDGASLDPDGTQSDGQSYPPVPTEDDQE
ncbi:MAG TPA: hypothetical protein VG755_30200 [Nannocystaceae bacterium]|nr:hypothetical protein [Nannocystaceae bacterium]